MATAWECDSNEYVDTGSPPQESYCQSILAYGMPEGCLASSQSERVLGKGGRHRQQPYMRLFGVESMATVRGALDETMIEMPAPPSRRAPDRGDKSDRSKTSGLNGWTKLKNR